MAVVLAVKYYSITIISIQLGMEESIMPRKGENIYKRRDGRWEARYVKGYEVSGKIKYGFCYGKTYKEAKEKSEQMKAAVRGAAALPQETGRHRLSFYCDEWLKLQRVKVKESTYVRYDTILERHIKPKLGSCFPLSLCDSLIDNFTQELLHVKKLSAKTVKDILVVLRSVLKYTAKQFPGVFPMLQFSYPKDSKSTARVLTQEEQERFIVYLLNEMDPCKFGILLALLTGIRIGELCALKWEDISLGEKTITIRATMQRLKNLDDDTAKTKVTVGDPKSDSSARVIPLTEYAVQLVGRMNPNNPAAFILTGTEHYMEPRTLQYRLAKYTKECGLDDVHFHTLRHTFATRCIEVGFEIKSLSEILGHANTAITLDRYVHASIDLKRDNMKKLSVIGL